MNNENLSVNVNCLASHLNVFGNNLMLCLKQYNGHLLNLKTQLKVMIKFGTENYPRIMLTAKEFFIRALILSDIKRLSIEILQLADNIEFIKDDIEDYNASKLALPGKSRRKLALSIELFFIIVFRAEYAISFVNYLLNFMIVWNVLYY